MFYLKNEKLEKKIRQSKVLKIKLSPQELEKFIQQAMTLPPAGQKELEESIDKELFDDDMRNNRKILALQNYQNFADRVLKKFENKMSEVAAKEGKKAAIDKSEELIKQASQEI